LTDPGRSLSGVVESARKTVLTRPWAWWIQWWWTDLLLAAAVVVVLAESAHPGTGVDVLGQIDLADRQGAYTDALQLTSIFAASNGVVFAIYLGFASRRVQQVKIAVGVSLLKVWLAALILPWVCAIIIVGCDVTDRGGHASGNVSRWVAIAALIVVFLQVIRIMWVFYQLAVTEFGASKPRAEVSPEEVRVVGKRAS
jgi:hypothetical protein